MPKISRIFIKLLPLIILLVSCSVASSPQKTGTSSNLAFHTSSPPSLTKTSSAVPVIPQTTASKFSPSSPRPSPVSRFEVWIDPHLPDEVANLLSINPQGRGTFELISDANAADIRIHVSEQNVIGGWIYALVAPFPTVIDGVTIEDIRSIWGGESSSSYPDQILLLEENTQTIFSQLWGEPDQDSIIERPSEDLLNFAMNNQPSWALIPFDELDPHWKVLEIDGQSPIHKDFDPNAYPLNISLGYSGDDSFGKLVVELLNLPINNWQADKLTTLSLTGVTALVRGTALTMEYKGITYPALDIGDILLNSDLTHVNNEVPFAANCPFPELNTTSLVFCSDPKYIELLEAIGTDIVELSGDHFADYGPEAMRITLDMYAQQGWKVYGGGENEESAREPILIEHNGNRIAMIGCNIGCEIKNEISCKALAQRNQPGAATCDFDWLAEEIKTLTGQGYNVVFTFQHKEYYSYTPQPDLIRDFSKIANAGATIISGSQAHQPHAFTLLNSTFIHYGLGNLFFDQYNYCAQLACNDSFIDQHIFYDNRHISTELITIRFVDMARPRLMTPDERAVFLEMIFQLSDW